MTRILHSAKAGFWRGVDSLSRHELARKRLGERTYRAVGSYPITLFERDHQVAPSQLAFWQSVEAGRWEPDLFAFIEEHVHEDTVYCDVGAWIGPSVLAAAQRASLVICLEPDPIAYRDLLWTISLNGLSNVLPMNVGLAAETGVGSISTGGSRHFGHSTSRTHTDPHGDSSLPAALLSIDDVGRIVGDEQISVMKIDIEGGEFTLIPKLRHFLEATSPSLHLSVHAPLLPESERRAALDQLWDALDMYASCRDEEGRSVTREEFAGPAAQQQFRAFVFLS